MAAEFLQHLSISDDERSKLATFGAKTPKALLDMRKASKQAFDTYIGQDRADAVAGELEKLLTDEERRSPTKPPKGAGRFGARMDPLPKDRH